MNPRPIIHTLLAVSLTPFLGGCVSGSRRESPRTAWLPRGSVSDVQPVPSAASFTAPATVRVRLLRTRAAARVGATGSFEYRSVKGKIAYTSTSSLAARAGKSSLIVGARTFGADVQLRPLKEGDFLTVNGRRYRGMIRLHRAGAGVVEVIEEVGLEPYLYGVLPKEVGANWPEEALKAQAVISRTYVLANLAKDPAQRYDVSNDVMHQVYGGLESENPAASRAVEETRGLVLLDKGGQPLQTFFHASCGGETELPDAVWTARVSNESYACVSDAYCRDYPRQAWSVEIPWTRVTQRLRRAGLGVRDVKKISVVKKTPSGRVEVFGVHTSRGTVPVQANRFRLALGPETLRSTRLTDIDNGRRSVRFKGLGWGHGVGLCQWGARGRALAGHSYTQILDVYFPSARLTRLVPS